MKRLLSELLAVVMILVISLGLVGCQAENNNSNDGQNDITHSHTFEEWKTTKKPSCTDDGEETRFCSCGKRQTVAISAIGHSFVDGECENCGENQKHNAYLNSFKCRRDVSVLHKLIKEQGNAINNYKGGEYHTHRCEDRADYFFGFIANISCAVDSNRARGRFRNRHQIHKLVVI